MRESITFRRLNNLVPTEQSCTFKLLEEVGEVMELIGKRKGLSGEQVAEIGEQNLDLDLIMEYMDVAQSAVTAIIILCEKHDIEISDIEIDHYVKLIERGYLK
jgi:NTP pyrophosphatase (non-canonical NTP hydrolase)